MLMVFCFQGQSECEANKICASLIETERMLSMLCGLRAHHMVRGPSVLFAEMDNKKLLGQEIFASGMEPQPYLTLEKQKPPQQLDHDDINLKKKSMIESATYQAEGEEDQSLKEEKSTENDTNEKDDGHSIKLEVVVTHEDTSHQHHTADMEHCRSFLSHLVSIPFTGNPEVLSFLLAIQQYSKSKGMIITVDMKEGHPLEAFGRVFMACLLKMLDMTSLAIKVGATVMSRQQETVSLPLPLVELNKLVYDTKVALVKVTIDLTQTHTHTLYHIYFILQGTSREFTNV